MITTGTQGSRQRQAPKQRYFEPCRGGVRLLAVVVAATVLSRAYSEALPAGPHALPRGGAVRAPLELGWASSPPIGRRRAGVRRDGVQSSEAFFLLRGGGFSWGGSEESASAASTRSNRGASGMFGSSWGGGDSNNDGNNGGKDRDNRRRVDTRGPPDLNAPLPPTAPGTGTRSGSESGGLGRERIRTAPPPDAGQGSNGGRRASGRASSGGGLFSSSSSHRRPAPGAGGRADPFWPNGKVSARGDDGEGGGHFPGRRGWREEGVPVAGKRGLMAVHYLVLSCFGLFSANTLFGVGRLFGLSLDHKKPQWWQPVTSLLLHGDQHHLMGNMFNLMIFGKMAEEDMGSLGMLASFAFCGVVSSLVSVLMMPSTISSCGASGAIFGLYSVCVLGKMFDVGRNSYSEGRLRKLIEAAVFGWFVVDSVMSELRMVAAGGVRGTDHAAHFGGVFAGAVLILLARRSIRDKVD